MVFVCPEDRPYVTTERRKNYGGPGWGPPSEAEEEEECVVKMLSTHLYEVMAFMAISVMQIRIAVCHSPLRDACHKG